MSANNWLGTDYLGRDIFARIIAGASVSLWVPAAVVGLSLVGAIPIGLIAGYRGGRTDQILMRLVDSGLSFPPLVMAMAVVAVLGAGEEDAVIALAVVFTPALARLVRGQTVAVRAESFVEASRSLGSSSTFISLRRVLPNIMSVLVVQATLIMSTTLIAEAGLSFLGLGAQPPAATWGSMLQQAYSYSLFVQPWSLFWPGAAIALTVLAFNSLGDAFTSAFGLVRPSPSQRRRPRGIRGRRGLTAVERGGVASEAVASPTTACLEVRDLSVSVAVEAGQLTVVDGVSLTIEPGEILGLVGESGSGKTVTSMAVMRLLPSPPFVITGGSVLLDGRDLLSMELGEMRKVRGSDIAMVFQDPMSSLNPAQTVGAQISEAIRLHRGASRREAWQRAVDLLDRVGIPDAAKRARSYPHQLSGGMRQRVMIAMALSCGPRLIIADEPTTALDVTVQAQVMQLLRDLAREENVAVLFVTHDLAVVSELCDRVVVMYAGQIVESASTADVFVAPRHPYTEGLIGASRHSSDGRRPQAILGQVPQLDNMPRGCRFAPRCQYVEAACVSTPQVLAPVADEALSRALEKQDQQQLSRCRREHDLELGGVR
ncbi:MAG TPA: dipeptide/oligopeptide/nickel ABC transporter permease/ATP-binding protein [Solirubrobacteraceae bacterium]|nr:dipeptide/oligopeptide/nickel ABC transporter permease/ATP-binding protein [Solirubrobacteraceae bacterium]